MCDKQVRARQKAERVRRFLEWVCQSKIGLESVQELGYLANLRTINLIMAVWMKALVVEPYRSTSFASRRFMPSHAKVRSTIQRFGNTSKPAWFRLMISTGRGLDFRTLGP